ncbi:hypothetical protein PF005_g17083 [Phytophthora fragariae]|uniref:AAA+ ATPase domain-containing protein n=1 Tax=Phytophthora fragariae TaxID=53985 RepID=A0A6A3X655_9STRA|nr:hypothetical protein PF003_g15407 [Phytophthora fragariae]KAE9095495.1 hypothetical protein PF010_g16687 [Phytophthora fragariae]KAE9095892.1 hypothetical protein PF007_g17220 [Phytophthora fragariae]KAE9195926.1 hypothetical protein PF005_g17083 [Phytophthora fragariae]KAE9212128.1 hypothetical protein PF002_g18335 [Phytophthora fragariae]
MPWSARACSGDAAAALLQPQQVLIAHEDAARHSVKHLDLVCVLFATHSSVLLECVIDRPASSRTTGAALTGGRVQVHAWVLDVCGQLEDAVTTLEQVEPAGPAASWRLSLSLQTKFPAVATSGSDSVGLELGDARTHLLPESVRRRQIVLEGAIRRQMRAAGTLRTPREGQLVPVRLLGDTFVFRIDVAETTSETSQVAVSGWSEESDEGTDADTAELTQQVEALSIQEDDQSGTTRASYESELDARLSHAGFAGYTAFVQDVLLNLALVLKRGQKGPDDETEVEQIGSHGILISGVHGVGKSQALVALQRELLQEKIGTWRVDGMSLLMGAESPAFPSAYEYLTHELEQKFPTLGSLSDVETAASSCVGVVLIDDLDVLFQSADGQVADGSDAQLPQLGSALLRLIDELSLRNARLVIVGTTTSADANVPLAAKRTGRFGKVLDLVVPTEHSRREILRRHLIGLPLRNDEETSVGDDAGSLASRLASLTGGYVAKDLVRICRNAAAQAHADSIDNGGSLKPSVGWTKLLHAQQQVKPSQLRELNVASPGAPVDGKLVFAGYAAVQKQLFDFVSWKFHPTDAMNRLGISNASGILLSGPSGCGKTLLVQTLAAKAQVNFVSVKSSELLSKYFGDSEKAVRQLFARARAAAPCILFFDEFDSIAHKRSFGEGDGGSCGGGVYARVLSTFLNEMDGVGSQRVTTSSVSHAKGSSASESGGILVIAATNRKNALDAALIRPGRIDKTVELGFPTQEDIQEIFTLYTRKMPLAADVDIQALAERPRGSRAFTGADIAATCKEAAFRALREDIEAKIVCLRHFEAAWDQRAEASPTYTPATANPESIADL